MNSMTSGLAGIDPCDFTIGKMLMVGAEPGVYEGLSLTDQVLLSLARQQLENWKLPYLANAHENVRVMNILPEFGGEDFLKIAAQASMVILCNIPHTIPDNLDQYRGAGYGLLTKSFMSSRDHSNTVKWAEQLDKTSADIIMVAGIDSFTLGELNNGEFSSLETVSDGKNIQGFLIRKSFLERAETFLLVQDSPLYQVIETLHQDPQASFEYDDNLRRLRALHLA